MTDYELTTLLHKLLKMTNYAHFGAESRIGIVRLELESELDAIRERQLHALPQEKELTREPDGDVLWA